MQDITLLLGFKKICESHLVDFEEDKKVLECENCELKDVCFTRKRPFQFTKEDMLNLVDKIHSSFNGN